MKLLTSLPPTRKPMPTSKKLISLFQETHRSNLVVYGEEGGWSAMSKTVGLPVGIAAEMIMNGNIY